MFGKCKVCHEKDSRIADLKTQLSAQFALIKTLTEPQHYSSATTMEANYALEGAGMPQLHIPVTKEPTEAEKNEYLAIEQQAAAMLSGTY